MDTERNIYKVSLICEEDDCTTRHKSVVYCAGCDCSYCSDCWIRQKVHSRPRRALDGISHEQCDPLLARRLQAILDPDPGAAKTLHQEDQVAKWFGLARGEHEGLVLEEYGRYEALMWKLSAGGHVEPRYPHLVSFVGETNAGKSTLIKLLINHDPVKSQAHRSPGSLHAPVAGTAANDMDPTSGDVHLYLDPSSRRSTQPMLFADCEGFGAGDRAPVGARLQPQPPPSDHIEGPIHPLVRVRPIQWVEEGDQGRGNVVAELYPRLLYTFSDCVVFVVRNPKTIQGVITRLLEWGSSVLEKSINQPNLPHCIVVLNDTKWRTDERDWDLDYATATLLSAVGSGLGGGEAVPAFDRLRKHWGSLGRHIFSIEGLILCYYRTFRVVRIPSKPKYQQIEDQVGKLYQALRGHCARTPDERIGTGNHSDSNQFTFHLQSGFDHFTTDLQRPFDFAKTALTPDLHPETAMHLLRLVTTLRSVLYDSQPRQHRDRLMASNLWKLIPSLASSILLDWSRSRKCAIHTLFASYRDHFHRALTVYLDQHHPCAVTSTDGVRLCELVKAAHGCKDHQDGSGIFLAGEYKSVLDASFLERWMNAFEKEVNRTAQNRFRLGTFLGSGQRPRLESEIAAHIHVERLSEFFESVPVAMFQSHATCLCCMLNAPAHPLQCGHAICMACVRSYGGEDRASVKVSFCPLHRRSTSWRSPTIVRFIPEGSGVRALSLDGGRERGIVQLELLAAITREFRAMGAYIPIRSCFDLIVGAGTSALSAVLLSQEHNDETDVCETFTSLCARAFRKHAAARFLSKIRSKWFRPPSGPLISDLKTLFGDDVSFFGWNGGTAPDLKVAIPIAGLPGEPVKVLANYRRSEKRSVEGRKLYDFDVPQGPHEELKSWEATTLGMADQLSPADIRGGKTTSGLELGDPRDVAWHEARLLDSYAGGTDLLLSLGAGHAAKRILHLGAAPTGLRRARTSIVLPSGPPSHEHSPSDRGEEPGFQVEPPTPATAEFIRINRDFGNKSPEIRERVRRELREGPNLNALSGSLHRMIRHVSYRLIATFFYLKFEPLKLDHNVRSTVIASILCRFDDDSDEMRALCTILERRCKENFRPYFEVRPDRTDPTVSQSLPATTFEGIFISPKVAVSHDMLGEFASASLFLFPGDGLAPDGLPVSGSPQRNSLPKDLRSSPHQQRRSLQIFGSLTNFPAAISTKPTVYSASEVNMEELIDFASKWCGD